MLASILMESAGGFISDPDITPEMLKRYGYNSEHQIAMETTLELSEIFQESFFNMEELDFKYSYAAMEGASDAVLENIINTISAKGRAAIAKIKDFLMKLWKKIKTFFMNVKRFLDGIFMNAKKFATTYEKQLNKLTFKDETYEVDMYEYVDVKIGDYADKMTKLFTDALGKDGTLLDKLENADAVQHADYEAAKDENHPKHKEASEELAMYKEALNKGEEVMNKVCEMILIETFGKYGLKEDFSQSDLSQAIWSFARSGASDSSDMKSVTITSLSKYVDWLKNSNTYLREFDNGAKAADKAFKEAISVVDKYEKTLAKRYEDDKEYANMATKDARATSSAISKLQGYITTMASVCRAAIVERIAAYKKVCTGAFSHADKDSRPKAK